MSLAVTALALVSSLAMASAELTECTLETPGMARTEALCGSVVVGVAREGAPLAIHFAVLEATGTKKQPDPIVLLPGGPGQASTELAGIAALAFSKARRDRDVVLFDPRGTGRSMKLDCDDKRPLAEKLRASDEEEAALLEACARRLPLDPKEITTAHIARDLDAVRVALGVTTWNLVGISYGTRLALAYDRAFPGKARTLILDGVVPFSMKVGEHAAEDATRALDLLSRRAAYAPETRAQHEAGQRAASTPPTLIQITRDLRAKLDAEPAEVALAHPTTAVPLSLRIDGDTAAGVVRMLVYGEESAAILPPLLRAAHRGDLAPLAAQLVLGEKLERTMSQPMQLSILCSEDLAHLDAPTRSAPADGTPGSVASGNEEAVFPDFVAEMKQACARWPHATVDVRFHDDEPTSPTPALLLSGSADPVTPPAYGEAARKTLTNSVHVTARGVGHNVIFRGCVPELVSRFLKAPDPVALDVTCTERLGPFPVFIDGMGPAP